MITTINEYKKFISKKNFQLIKENFSQNVTPKYKLYHGINQDTKYEYIIVLDENLSIKGFATNGYQTEQMIKENVFTIGTILGPGIGNLLYSGFIKRIGNIIPSMNESDLAKNSWKKKLNDQNYIKSIKEGIGFYDRYEDEKYMNTVFDISEETKNNIVIEELDDMHLSTYLYNDLDVLHRFTSNVLIENKEKLYTIGQSTDRDSILKENNI